MNKLTALLLVAFAVAGPLKVAAVETPPPPGPPRSVTYPTPVERTLANGLRVVVVRRTTVPLVVAQLVIKSGSEADPTQKPGLASFVADLLTQGTTTRSALEIAQTTDSLGAELGADAGWDATRISVSATAPKFARAFELFADVVRRPSLLDAEFERARTRTLSALQLTYSDPSALAQLVAARVLYGDAPYGHPRAGTPESVAALGRADLTDFHQTYYRPDNAILIFGGDIDPQVAFAEAERVFGDWSASGSAPTAQPGKSSQPVRSRVVVVDQPDAGRTAVVVGRVAFARTSPDYFPGVVSNAVLSGYSGRLNAEVRIKRGLSYGAGTQLQARREPGPFLASTLVDNARGAEGTSVVLRTVTNLASSPVGVAELIPRKAVVIGSFSRSLETIGGVVGQVGSLALYGLPLAQINTFISSTEAVTPVQIQDFARKYLSQDLSVVLVGNAKQFVPELRKRFAQVEVIPFTGLDLGRTDLSKPTTAVQKR